MHALPDLLLEHLPRRLGLRLTSLRRRITLVFVFLVLLCEATTLVVLSVAGAGIAQQQIHGDLDQAGRIFGRQLETNRERLTQTSRVLAADFGFREALGTQDAATIDSVLENHGGRIGADLMMLADNDSRLLGSVPQLPDGSRFPFAALLTQAQQQASASSAVVVFDGDAYQLVVVPVLAPLPIAWIAMGFVLDNAAALDLAELSAMDVSFVLRQASGAPLLLGSSLRPAERRQLTEALAHRLSHTDRDTEMVLGDRRYLSRYRDLASDEGSEVTAVLQRSVDQVMAPFRRLQQVLLVLIAVSLCLAIGMVWVLSGRLSGPLQRLTLSARRMQDGHYDEPIRAESGDELGVLADSLNHMREGIAAREAQILALAYQDPLTGLPNRLGLKEQIKAGIAITGTAPHAMLLLNLNRFRFINSTLDFKAGDEVLRQVANRLLAGLPPDASLARLGSDEFAVWAPVGTLGGVEALVRTLQRNFMSPLMVGEQPLDISCAIGTARYPDDAEDAPTLLRYADLACRVAKRRQVDHAPYDAATMRTQQAHLSMLGELRRAIAHDELQLWYQPKICCNDASIGGVEALVRWIHPQRGFVSPGEFIPFAESTGSIRAITRWVLATGLRDCRDWRARGHDFTLSLNLSTRDLLDDDLVDYVQQQLRLNQVPPAQLCLEITESGLMENPEHSRATLQRLDALGVKLSVDDYGTGYSSLAYVKELPIDELKIDRAFIKDLVAQRRDRAIVRSTIDLGHQLGLYVTAEGVEDQQSVDYLLDMGCDLIQGYVFSKPLPYPKLLDWLASTGRTRRPVSALSA